MIKFLSYKCGKSFEKCDLNKFLLHPNSIIKDNKVDKQNKPNANIKKVLPINNASNSTNNKAKSNNTNKELKQEENKLLALYKENKELKEKLKTLEKLYTIKELKFKEVGSSDLTWNNTSKVTNLRKEQDKKVEKSIFIDNQIF